MPWAIGAFCTRQDPLEVADAFRLPSMPQPTRVAMSRAAATLLLNVSATKLVGVLESDG